MQSLTKQETVSCYTFTTILARCHQQSLEMLGQMLRSKDHAPTLFLNPWIGWMGIWVAKLASVFISTPPL